MAEQVGQQVLAVVDLHIRQGSDASFVIEYADEVDGVPVIADYTGWTARSQIRRKVGGEVWLDLAPHLTVTHTDTALTVTGNIPAAVTEGEDWNRRASREVDGELAPAGVWDIELVTPTRVIPLLEGVVFVDPDVTRAV